MNRWIRLAITAIAVVLGSVAGVVAADEAAAAAATTADPSVDGLIQWIKSKGGDVRGIEIRTDGPRGRGFFAKRDIPKGEVITRTPFSTLINIEHALSHTELGSVIREEMDDLSDTTIMGSFIAYLKYTTNPQTSNDWKPYISALPTELTTPVYYTPRVLAELKGSAVYGFVLKRMSATDASYEKLSRTITDVISKEQFLWGLSILWSRTFGVKVKDGDGQWQKAPCFVPLADLFNTGSATQLNTDCRTTANSKFFECFATSTITAGSELLVPYGHELGNGQLLLDYGLVQPNNTFTTLTLTPSMFEFPDAPELIVNEFRKRLMEHFKFTETGKIIFPVSKPTPKQVRASKFGKPLGGKGKGVFPLPLLMYVRMRLLDMATLNGLKGGDANQQDVANSLRANEVMSAEHESRVVTALMTALQKLLAVYTTPLAEDVLRLNTEDFCLASYSKSECEMFRAVLSLRTEEKMALTQNIELLKNYERGLLKKLSAQTAENAPRNTAREEL